MANVNLTILCLTKQIKIFTMLKIFVRRLLVNWDLHLGVTQKLFINPMDVLMNHAVSVGLVILLK
jgi:hypothetical protein